MVFVKRQQSLIPHFSELQRQPAALHAEVIRQLLPGKGDIKLIASPALRLGGKIRHQLGARGALPHMGQLFIQQQVLFRQLPQQVADDPPVVHAGGGADAQNTLYPQKHHRDCALRLHAHIQHRSRRAGKYLGEGLPRPGLGKDIAVAPYILLHDEHAPHQHKPHLLRRIPGTQQPGALGEGVDPRRKAGEHGGKLLPGNAGKQRRCMEHREKFLHKNVPFVENSTDLLYLV